MMKTFQTFKMELRYQIEKEVVEMLEKATTTLSAMSYKELQKEAKAYEIKANQKSDALKEQIIDVLVSMFMENLGTTGSYLKVKYTFKTTIGAIVEIIDEEGVKALYDSMGYTTEAVIIDEDDDDNDVVSSEDYVATEEEPAEKSVVTKVKVFYFDDNYNRKEVEVTKLNPADLGINGEKITMIAHRLFVGYSFKDKEGIVSYGPKAYVSRQQNVFYSGCELVDESNLNKIIQAVFYTRDARAVKLIKMCLVQLGLITLATVWDSKASCKKQAFIIGSRMHKYYEKYKDGLKGWYNFNPSTAGGGANNGN